MNRVFIVALIMFAMLVPLSLAAEPPSDTRPNILLLMTDQHAATALSCGGNPD